MMRRIVTDATRHRVTVLDVAQGRGAAKRVRRAQPEAVMQRALVARLRLAPFLRDVLWSAWPNGGKRDPRTAALMKAEGVNPGPLDLWFFADQWEEEWADGGGRIRTRRFVGLVLELKAGKNTMTPEQRRWRDGLVAQGWCVRTITDDVDVAWRVVVDYFNGREPEATR